MGRDRFRSITISEGESDLWIGWNLGKDSILMNDVPGGGPDDASSGSPDSNLGSGPDSSPRGAELEDAVRRLVATELCRVRSEILAYGAAHPEFLSSFEPLPLDPAAPPAVHSMLIAGQAAEVGPMAAVAGAVAGAVASAIASDLGNTLQNKFGFAELIIENGGDYWISIRKPLPVQVYAGLSSLSGKVSVIVPPELSPCGLACSSGTVGPSTSFGKADAALVIAKNAAAADAWATALGNRLHSQNDLAPAVEELINTNYTDIEEEYRPLGALAIMADKLAACGCIRLG